MTPREYNYNDSGDPNRPSNATIRTTRTTAGYAVVIHWPAGCQEFPDVLRCEDVRELESRLNVAQIMVERLGFKPCDAAAT